MNKEELQELIKKGKLNENFISTLDKLFDKYNETLKGLVAR